MSSISILNCTMGDMQFSFDSDDPQEVERARRCVEDMLKRGYILFVHTKAGLRKVTKFNRKNDTYVIADGPETAPPEKNDADESSQAPKKGRKGKAKEVPAKSSKATAIAPTAGG